MSYRWTPITPPYTRLKTGRCANGGHRDGGYITHAVDESRSPCWSPAVCGTRPGRTSGGWSEPYDTEPTCPRCRKILGIDRSV